MQWNKSRENAMHRDPSVAEKTDVDAPTDTAHRAGLWRIILYF